MLESNNEEERSTISLLQQRDQPLPSEEVFKAHRLCVSLNSRLESNNEEKKKRGHLERC